MEFQMGLQMGLPALCRSDPWAEVLDVDAARNVTEEQFQVAVRRGGSRRRLQGSPVHLIGLRASVGESSAAAGGASSLKTRQSRGDRSQLILTGGYSSVVNTAADLLNKRSAEYEIYRSTQQLAVSAKKPSSQPDIFLRRASADSWAINILGFKAL
ncbi:hypothetical protein CMQ_2338 [Grosmannia clavigera kw1407]|uniref:Uncharacterized protein n=1 Tax=Grosmannia clavigera (strain kw1407 / UAMH 11150) TaxID=655863 RepID=F0XJ38_GROCL|nr:uncharacterized protein CMQ_2338 [Grosmannia clavigera kw1407]EFX02289.1 hypothetical protein CMQ_2338 [Grosmannia clavigera kw1407]